MQKPATVAYEEFGTEIERIINNCGLPAFIIIPLLKSAIAQLEEIKERQYQRDLEEWNKAVEADGEQTDE